MPLMMKSILKTLNGQPSQTPPFWFMRQAGRYLPEYKQTRAEAGGFLDLCYNPDFATEVTLQPLRRYSMDAAILFSDILVIPDALGQDVKFVAGEGPKLNPIRNIEALSKLGMDQFHEHLNPVYESVSSIRSALRREGFNDTALIGFAGSPWTVACYMVEGGGSKEFLHVKRWAYQNPDDFEKLIDLLVTATSAYLCRQIESGAEIIQLFDSWSGVLSEAEFTRWVIEPTVKIINHLKSKHPDIPVIGFPKGAGSLYSHYVDKTGVDAVSIDFQVPLSQAKNLQMTRPVQGNLDPIALLSGGAALDREADRILEALSGENFIFNLGHGINKETPPEHVEQLSKRIRGL
jgi:uroporphyrinogen decarboxylase